MEYAYLYLPRSYMVWWDLIQVERVMCVVLDGVVYDVQDRGRCLCANTIQNWNNYGLLIGTTHYCKF